MRSLWVAFGGIGALKSGNVASVFHGGALHSEADAEERNLMLAGILDGVNHSLNAAVAEAARNKDAVVAAESCGSGLDRVDFFGFDPVQNSLVIVGQTSMEQRFAKALVGVFE